MKWIVGLGNPGSRYADTRHNVGFMALDRLAERWGISFQQNRFNARLGEGTVNGEKAVLLQPQTFMNLSGESVAAYRGFFKAQTEDLIVVYDDLDTPLGQIRLRLKGSAGGHNGIKSIIQHIGSQEFNRIRIGISRPGPDWDIANYVLSPFPKSERETLKQVLELTCDALEQTMKDPFEKVMAKFNARAGE
ncbi:aminoacyl-tRNA hydrolase [Ferviditalea candida]|uniref:Peptidyl-tRNA hydrolase n=1 Tax=Ferviditalea candida TaxID=3108399 RepID=A0ABU5ZL65_9BACL|nr:aminoacyl-tRNA hydrolase [Paenibacillaceae bacterium T2]